MRPALIWPRLMAAGLLMGSLLLGACSRESLHSQESFVFGTRVEVLVWSGDGATARTATAEVLREFDRLHRAYHAWQPSELTALNEAIAAGRPHEVSAELAGLIVAAQALAAKSDYLFDPGIGALVKLWGFHDDTFKARLPDPQELARLKKAKPSIAKLKMDGAACPPPGRPKAGAANEPEPRSGEQPSPQLGRGTGGGCRPPSGGFHISSADASVALDFGGYLKGVALDRAAAIMRSHGIANALINIGGNVLALGAKGDVPWRVGIQHPRAAQTGGVPLATLDLRDGEAIGTSGDYQRYFELDGRRYCHLIDPRTSEPAVGTQSVTVLIPPRENAGMWSDVASKPLFIAGADWRRPAAALGLDHILRVDAAGRIEISAALRPRLKLESKP